MELRILGSGASTGVPIIACPCAICHSDNPYNKRTRPSALLTTDNGENILIDTSPDFRQQALAFNIRRIDAVLFTHTHSDHVMGFDDLRAFNFLQPDYIIPCYATNETIKSMNQVFSYIFTPPEHYQGGMLARVGFHEIFNGVPFTVCNVPITPFKLIHGSTPTTGFRIGDTAYVTDCNKLPGETLKILEGSKNIIIDGLREKPHATHLTINEAIDIAKSLGAERTIITHMSHTIDYAKVSAELPAGVCLAYDGLTIPVSI